MNRSFLHIALLCLANVLCLAGTVGVDALTRASGDGRTASSGSFAPVFSADGQHVVFLSSAANLVTNDDSTMSLDVFLYAIPADRTMLVSVAASGIAGGNNDSSQPAVSRDGQVIVFASRATNLLALPPVLFFRQGLFVRDRSTDQTVLANLSAGKPILSDNGRFLAFETSANPGPLPDANNGIDVFVQDLQSGLVEVVSINAQGTSTANSSSTLVQIAADGRTVLFWSFSTNILSPNLPSASLHIYLRELDAGVTRWISSNAAAFSQMPTSIGATLSEDGRFAVYLSQAGNMAFHHEVATTTTLLMASNVARSVPPRISADGARVTYGDGTNIFVWDRHTQSNELVSVAPDGITPGNDPSYSPVITPDGRYVCFLSASTNLVTNSLNGLVQVFVRDMLSGTLRLASINTNNAASNSGVTGYPAITPDGRLVAFASTASDIVPDDLNATSDVFLYNLATANMKVISRRAESRPARTSSGLNRLWPGAVSSDGQTVAFTSQDNSLAADDTNRLSDIFVFSSLANTITVVNPEPATDPSHASVTERPLLSRNGRRLLYARRTHGPRQANDFQTISYDTYWRDLENGRTERLTHSEGNVSISADGRWVGFHSSSNATTIGTAVPLDQNNVSDAFVRDMETGSNILVSWRFDMTRTANDISSNTTVSPNGRWAIFQSLATDLTPTYVGFPDLRLFARDLLSNRTEEIGLDGDWSVGYEVDFTPDSRFAAFAWLTTPSAPVFYPNMRLYDFQTLSNISVCDRCRYPAISEDGRFVAYETSPPSAETKQVFVKSIASGLTKLLSSTAAGTNGNKHSTSPQITPDGRYVIFESKASDLVPNDTNGVSDIFLADRLRGTLMMLTVNQSGAPADNISSMPVLSDDGRSLYFQSFASDLVDGDYNYTRDIFLLRLSEPDSDNDGMDDDWEVAFFGDLSRNVAGDLDADGHTDLQEFLAGTDPTNDASILRVLTLTRLQGGAKTILWSAVPGRVYRVQYKNSLSQSSWIELPPLVTATTSTASTTDNNITPANRFYRVILAE